MTEQAEANTNDFYPSLQLHTGFRFILLLGAGPGERFAGPRLRY
jgi:hypothetical protein